MNPLAKIFVSLFGADTGGKTFHPSQTCSECGSRLRNETAASAAQAQWLCPNPDCPAQVRRWLAHWCAPEVMDIPGGDAALVAKLVAHGLARDVAELYRIKVKELAALPGMNAVAAQKIFEAISLSLKRDAWRLLSGLNIPLVGAAEAQALARSFPTVDAVFAAGAPRLMQDAGVSEAVAQSVVRWHSDGVNRKLVRRLNKAGLNFRSELLRP